jgi:hypothetical protein
MQRTVVKRAIIVALVGVGALGLDAGPVGARQTDDSGGGAQPFVETYDNGAPLANAEIMTVTGRKTGDGGCSFEFPDLELAPDDIAIEARQIETNFTDCTTKVEIGTPAATDGQPQSGGTSVRETIKPGAPAATRPGGIAPSPSPGSSATSARSATTSGNGTSAALLATQSTGYWRVWWEDVINLRVHEVKTNVRWSWDGFSCVWGYSGWSDYWWLSGTGWAKDSSNQALFPSCDLADVTSVAVYRNGAFCWPGTVWSVYDNVRAQGRWDGWLLGSVTNTYTTYPFACPTLHWHSELRRTQN